MSLTGDIFVYFPSDNEFDNVVLFSVTYIVITDDIEYSPIQQFTWDQSIIVWHPDSLSAQERNSESGVKVQVRVIEFLA